MADYRCPRCSAIVSGDPATLVCPQCGFGQRPQQPPAPPASTWGQAPQQAWGQQPPQQASQGWGAQPSPPQGGQGWGTGGAAPGGPSSDDRTMAMLVHILGILTGFLGPLILWLVKRRDSPFVDQHGRAALDFCITVAILSFAGFLLFIVVAIATLGFGAIILLPVLILGAIALGVLGVVFGIMGALAANRGEPYRYPIAFRMLSPSR